MNGGMMFRERFGGISRWALKLLLLLILLAVKTGWGGMEEGRQDLTKLPYIMASETFSNILRDIVNNQLSYTKMQAIMDGLPSEEESQTPRDALNNMWNEMDGWIRLFQENLDGLGQVVSNDYRKRVETVSSLFRDFRECCQLKSNQLQWEGQYGTKVNRSTWCDILPPSTVSFSQLSFYPGKALLPVMKKNGGRLSGLKWQYFISKEGLHIEYPANKLNWKPSAGRQACLRNEPIHHRSVFLSTALPIPKHIVLLLEFGNSPSSAHLARIREVGRLLLESMGDGMSEDRVGVVIVGGRTNHSRGFEEAFRILKEGKKPADVHNYVFYVSRGLLSTLVEASQVFQTIAKETLQTGLRVQINTFPIIEQRSTFVTQFLGKLAAQNFTAHLPSFPTDLRTRFAHYLKQNPPLPVGKMTIVNGSAEDTLPLSHVYSVIKPSDLNHLRTEQHRNVTYCSEPYRDNKMPPSFKSHRERITSQIISMGRQVWHSDTFLGIVGQDVSLEGITSKLRYANPAHFKAYFMLIDPTGNLLFHPRIPAGSGWRLRIDEMEEWSDSADHIERYIDKLTAGDKSGRITLKTHLTNHHLSTPHPTTTSSVTYWWKKLGSNEKWILIYCIPDFEDGKEESGIVTRLKPFEKSIGNQLVYHRMDLLSNSGRKLINYCMNFKQLASTDVGSVYLSPKAFRFGYMHSVRGETKKSASSVWAYLTDTSRLVAGIDLTPGVKEEVAGLSGIIPTWMEMSKDSKYSRYILRRFVGNSNGVLVAYPASLLSSDYHHSDRPWYKGALRYPGWVVVSRPYLDPAGVGYVVTISHTLYYGKSNALHHQTDQIFGVMGMDVRPEFLYQLLGDQVSMCGKAGMDCLLMEEGGYLVGQGSPYSRHMTERQPVESRHVAHQEPSLAVHLLQKPSLVNKTFCKRMSDRTIQRAYVFNTSFNDVTSGSELFGCSEFHLSGISRSNVLLIFINKTCVGSGGSPFCPCSVSDRRCLNCEKPDPDDCECPCQCVLQQPFLSQKCSAKDIMKWVDESYEEDLPRCGLDEESFTLPKVTGSMISTLFNVRNMNDIDKNLPECGGGGKCGSYGYADCMGLMGCEWCTREENGKTRLKQAYCAAVDTCFGGVFGRSPYGHIHYMDDDMTVSTPVGPVAGAIMGVFVLLAMGVFCFRHQMSRMVEGRGSQSGSGARLAMSMEEDMMDEFIFDQEGSNKRGGGAGGAGAAPVIPVANNLRPHQLASFERVAVGALQGAENWRRGPQTESSDHGYSTMTGNCEDSEQAGSASIIPLQTHQPLLSAVNNSNNQQSLSARRRSTRLYNNNTSSYQLPPEMDKNKLLMEVDPIVMPAAKSKYDSETLKSSKCSSKDGESLLLSNNTKTSSNEDMDNSSSSSPNATLTSTTTLEEDNNSSSNNNTTLVLCTAQIHHPIDAQ